jgi:nicotinamidase-related amidase
MRALERGPARELGFDVELVEDATRGVDVEPGDTERALGELRESGVRFVSTDELARRNAK